MLLFRKYLTLSNIYITSIDLFTNLNRDIQFIKFYNFIFLENIESPNGWFNAVTRPAQSGAEARDCGFLQRGVTVTALIKLQMSLIIVLVAPHPPHRSPRPPPAAPHPPRPSPRAARAPRAADLLLVNMRLHRILLINFHKCDPN